MIPAFNRGLVLAAAVLALVLPAQALAQPTPPPLSPVTVSPEDGPHAFDFLIGDWKVHVRRLPDRLVGSTKWLDYDGASTVSRVYGSNANIEDFKVDDAKDDLHIHGQTLRLYNPASQQWNVFPFDVAKGTLGYPQTAGRFSGGRGELYDYEEWNGAWVLVRFVWTHSGDKAHFEQAFSPDGGKTWEVNWISDQTRIKP